MNGSELYQYILDHTRHNLQGTWETTEQNQLKVTGTNVNGSYVVFSELGALNNFILEWEITVLASAIAVNKVNSGISPILLTDPTGSSIEGWNNGTITNAKFVYFMCNWSGSGDGNVGTLKSIRDNGSMSNVNSSTGSFIVGTKYTYKLVRADRYLRLYQDNNLISEYQETTYANTPFYLGWYMWWGGTYREYQANFIIDNYVITDLGTDTINYVNKPGLAEVWANIKNYVTAQLLGKQDTLVSGSNIKTVNNQSLLGSGNVTFTPPTFTYDSSTETLTVSNTTATVFNYDAQTETLEVQING